MARYTGTVTINDTYNIRSYSPLDSRMLVPTYADLLLESNWDIPDYGSVAYNGMIVAVGSDITNPSKNGLYLLYDPLNPAADDFPDVTQEVNWRKVADNFTTDGTLSLANGVLSVNTANTAEADNTLPITSAAVNAEIGNINAVLEMI